MIFSELYSVYYNTVAKILTKVLAGPSTSKELEKIVAENAFGESVLTVLPSLKDGRWQLMREDLTTSLEHIPSMPTTLLQKQWLKAISLDPRIKLFGVEIEGIDDVEPLFTPDDYYVYDKYGDGDPFDDADYVERFRFLMSAIREQAPIEVNITNKNGKNVYTKCIPKRLEYSQKDDKFRLITSGCRIMPTINLSKITSCSRYIGGQNIRKTKNPTYYKTLTLQVTDERNGLERVMLHFAHFEKRAEKIGRNEYIVRIKYDYNDESEIVVRVLSFGPLVKVIESESLVGHIKDKLLQQKICDN